MKKYFLYSFLFSLFIVTGARGQVLIIENEKVQSDFLGMGYNKIPAIDFKSDVYNTVIGKRIKEVAANGYYRIFDFSTAWYAPTATTINFDNAEMQAYINKLELFRENGIRVIHTQEYQRNPEWLGGGKLVTDTVLLHKIAETYAIGMEHLIIKKGFTNIHSWELTNELNLKDKKNWGGFYLLGEEYKKAHQDIIRMVRDAFDQHGLQSLVIRTPGISENKLWKWGTDNHPASSMSDIHWYFKRKEPWATTWDIGNGNMVESTDSITWASPIQYDHQFQSYQYRLDYARSRGKDLAVGEFGPTTAAGDAKMPMGECYYETAYGATGTGKLGMVIAEQAMAILNVGAKTIQKWCFADLDYSGGKLNYYHGTMKGANGNWQTRSDYYAYGLMTRYIRSNSSVFKTISLDSLIRITGVKNNQDNHWTIVVMNRNNKAATVSIQNKAEKRSLKYRRFIYQMDSVPQNKFGDLQGFDKELIAKSGAISDMLPPQSLALYTTEFVASKPEEVKGLRSEVVANEVRLTWQEATDSLFCYYRVYQGSTKSFVPNKNNQIGSTICNTFSLPRIDHSTFFFKVKAVDKYGNEGE